MAGETNFAQADRMRAILLALSGRTSERSTEALGVGEVMVRVLRSEFMAGGIDALAASVTSDSSRVKAQTAEGWRPAAQSATGHWSALPRKSTSRASIFRSAALQGTAQERGSVPAAAAHPEGPKVASEIDRVSRLRKVGEILLPALAGARLSQARRRPQDARAGQ